MKKISFFITNLEVAGAERVFVSLANEFSRKGFNVDLVLCERKGGLLSDVLADVRVVNLNSHRIRFSLPKLVKYLKYEKPSILISALDTVNIISILACRIVKKVDIKLILTVHSTISKHHQGHRYFRSRLIPYITKFLYRYSDHVVAVSNGVKEDMVSNNILDKNKISVIYNPIVNESHFLSAKEEVGHQWFIDKKQPIVIAIGRLVKQKNFHMLIESFSRVSHQTPAKLVILGEGDQRLELEGLVKQLKLSDCVFMPGVVKNPFAFVARSDLFVLSSSWEGFGNVLVEAMALGVPVISTRCHSGPSEILENGKFGIMVDVGDIDDLSKKMLAVLTRGYELNTKLAKQSVEYRFDVGKIANKYLEIC